MELCFHHGGAETWQSDIVLVPILDGSDIVSTNTELDNACPWLRTAPGYQDVSPHKHRLHMVYGGQEGLCRVLFLGLGKEADFSLDIFREGIGKAVAFANTYAFSHMLCSVSLLASLPFGKHRLLEELVYAAHLANDVYAPLKKADPNTHTLQTLTIAHPTPDPLLEKAAHKGAHAASATLFARHLAAMPANHLSPVHFAHQAVSMAKRAHIPCSVLDEQNMRQEGMEALLAVGQGSKNPPRLIVLDYASPNAQDQDPLLLIGKGICFDAGGISLKPPAKMHEMKSDMSGAACVIACMEQVAKEGLDCHVVGIVACAENLPDGNAVRPGDVVRAMNGDTVEIINTDAEGRLVLCDAINYAKTHFHPKAIVDIATLTGACAVALGDAIAGLFTKHALLRDRLLAAGELCGQYLWPMPIWEGYRQKLNSDVADICHTGPRQGGASIAALFLAHFADKTPFAHLDIAGVDWAEHKTALCPKGPTGFGARTLLEFVRGGSL